MKVNKKLLLFFFSTILCLFCGFLKTNNVFANVSTTDWNDNITRKALLQVIKNCYYGGGVKNNIRIDEKEGGTLYANDVFDGNKYKVYLPSGYTTVTKDYVDSCKDLFIGPNSYWRGDSNKKKEENTLDLFTLSGNSNFNNHFSDVKEIAGVLGSLGYKGDETLKKSCRHFNYTALDTGSPVDKRESESICYGVNGLEKDYSGRMDDSLVFVVDGNKLTVSTPHDAFLTKDEIGTLEADGIVRTREYTITSKESFESAINDIKNVFAIIYATADGTGKPYKYGYENITGEDEVSGNYSFLNGSKSSAFDHALKLFDSNQSTNIIFNKQERIAYYIGAIKNSFLSRNPGAGNNNTSRSYDWDYYYRCDIESQEMMQTNYYQINIDINTGTKKSTCGFEKITGLGKINGFTNGSVFDTHGTKQLTFEETIAEINRLVGDFEEGETVTPDTPTPGTLGEDACYDSDKLNGMAWVLCPTLYNLKGASEGVGALIDELMEVDTVFYGSDSKAHEAWEVTRNVANVLIVIVLLVIIFSQLTGYGIDNYGIKKILPRLVVMAILINLSFLLCQIAIDLSNIVGNGINNLLQTIANTEVTASQGIAAAVDLILAGTAAIGANAGIITLTITAFASGGEPIVIVVLILALIAVFIGVLIFFMMLGARTIIIVLFTVLAPLAIACYILPNTQKYYKNWWKTFSTALMIFPICGATYGLSAIIRSIVFQGGELHILTALVAMLSPILPYYIMPTLLKNMMSTLGSVGSIFNSLRSGLNKGISGASSTLRDTESYKNAAKESANKRLNNYNTRRFNRLKNKDERIAKRRGQVGAPLGSNLTKRQQVDLARASEAMKKYDSESQAAAAVLAEREFGSRSESEMNTAWEEAYVNGETARLTALTDVMTSKYGSGAISTMGKIMSKHKDVDQNGKIASSLKALSDNTVANKDFGKLFRAKATDAFRMATTREVGEDGKLRNLDYYSNNNKISTTFEDVFGQGAKAVERTALAGGFNAMLGENSATKILENENSNPALQAFLSDKDKRRAVEAVAYAEKQGTTIKDIMNAHEGDAAYSSDKILETLSKAYRDIRGVKTATNGAAQPGQVFNVNNDGGTGGPEFDAGAFNRAKDARNTARSAAANAAANSAANNATSNTNAAGASDSPDFDVNAFNRARESRNQNKPQNGPGVM